MKMAEISNQAHRMAAEVCMRAPEALEDEATKIKEFWIVNLLVREAIINSMIILKITP